MISLNALGTKQEPRDRQMLILQFSARWACSSASKNLQTILFWHDICPSPHLQILRTDSISCMALSLTTTPVTDKPVWKMRIFHLPEDGVTTTYIIPVLDVTLYMILSSLFLMKRFVHAVTTAVLTPLPTLSNTSNFSNTAIASLSFSPSGSSSARTRAQQ